MPGEEIVFEALTKRYGSVDALVDFNLQVKPGEFVTLLGPSGSGKTTALNVLAGFLHPDGGDVRLGGQSVLRLPPEARGLGMVFQSYTLFPHMSVAENIAFPLRLRGRNKQAIDHRVGAVLEMVQMEKMMNRMPNELSGGQQQRVAFARAVAADPPVLLMDEPLGALDLKLRQSMQLEIKRYHASLGCTILFVTHDQEEALVLSDRIAVMGDGRIQQIDTPQRIYDKPNSRYVAEFIGKTNLLKCHTDRDGVTHIMDTGNRCRLTPPSPPGDAYVSLRPEHIIRHKPDSSCISFSGSVREAVFLGNVVQYLVRTEHDATVQFQEHRGIRQPLLRVSDRVTLHFEPHNILRV